MLAHSPIQGIGLADRAESVAHDARRALACLARMPAAAMDEEDRVEIALMRVGLATILAEMCSLAALSEDILERVGAMPQAHFMLTTARRDVGLLQTTALRALSSLRARHPV